ncbi:MAG: SOS response-associated peptidase [Ignavibacteriae bacterium]|nr:SOS response-associated peptidase [Ignavibacteriota bacterium]
MCGLFALSAKTKSVEKLLPKVKIPEDLKQRLTIAPTQDIAVVLNDGNNEITFVKWGLIPFWSKDSSIGKKMFNARGETLLEKPSFKNLLKNKRCVVIADGFYEWQKLEGNPKKVRHFIKMKSNEPFVFAGLWDAWIDKSTGESITTATIITTEPNELIAEIHERMPVIISPEKIDLWLEQGDNNLPELLSFLKPYPAEEMEISEY